METWQIILIVVAVVMVGIMIALYFFGKKMQKRQAEQDEQIAQHKQTVTMLIIDKKMMKLKDAGLPQAVIAQTPKLMRGSKLPIVKAKVGPQILSLVCDAKIFDTIPVKKEVKATVSGIYITEVRGIRGNIKPEDTKKKQSKFKQWVAKMREKAGATPVK